jgi:hypothetical protein
LARRSATIWLSSCSNGFFSSLIVVSRSILIRVARRWLLTVRQK